MAGAHTTLPIYTIMFFHVLWLFKNSQIAHTFVIYVQFVRKQLNSSYFFLFFLRWIIANCYKSNEIEWPMCGSHLVVFQSKILMTIEWMGENKWLKIEWMKKQKKKRGNKEYENEKHSEECDWMTFLRPFHCLNKPAWDSGNWNTHSLLCSDLKCIRYWIDPVRKGKHR